MASLDSRAVLYAAMTEHEWQQQVVAWARRGEWLVYHVHDSRVQEWGTDKGFPDLVLAKVGEPLWIPELKRESGRVLPHQERWLDTINSSQTHYAPVWRPSDGDRVRRLLCGQ